MARGQRKVLEESPQEGANQPENQKPYARTQTGGRTGDSVPALGVTQSLLLEWSLLTVYRTGRKGQGLEGRAQAVIGWAQAPQEDGRKVH